MRAVTAGLSVDVVAGAEVDGAAVVEVVASVEGGVGADSDAASEAAGGAARSMVASSAIWGGSSSTRAGLFAVMSGPTAPTVDHPSTPTEGLNRRVTPMNSNPIRAMVFFTSVAFLPCGVTPPRSHDRVRPGANAGRNCMRNAESPDLIKFLSSINAGLTLPSFTTW
jgi:hypothetical protein